MKVTHPQVEAMQREAYDFCMAYGKCPSRGYRLVIWGENGAGKSRMAKAVQNWAYRCGPRLPHVQSDKEGVEYGDGKRRPTSAYYHFPTLIRELTKDFERDVIGELCQPPNAPNLLVLDDVGAEHDPKKFAATQLYLILERRSAMWTVITTNASPDAWENKWDRRVSSRLIRNSKHVAVDKVPDFSSL